MPFDMGGQFAADWGYGMAATRERRELHTRLRSDNAVPRWVNSGGKKMGLFKILFGGGRKERPRTETMLPTPASTPVEQCHERHEISIAGVSHRQADLKRFWREWEYA